ncbi:hypothetical protein L6164_002391 [Bauhinia variegata]|uniref:Uncharacterized protein n=1 Tax=Bauhinia variegata TaxID=167791 RepID=A0ACB9PXI5_BAUVA|nr:hypothetical protein L6164_002391 [Bauhinia variegata]
MGYLISAALVTFFAWIISKIWQILLTVLWRPYALTRYFRKQGITGPPYSLFSGSLPEIRRTKKEARGMVMDTYSNDIAARVIPYYHTWSSLYGDFSTLLFLSLLTRGDFSVLVWNNPKGIHFCPELAKQVLSNKSGFYRKPETVSSTKALIGEEGLILRDGSEWAKHRRILNPAFSMDKLKVMIKRMAACTISMLDEWEREASEAKYKKIQMDEQFRELTADIIAHTAFGSSFVQGREAFNAQRELLKQSATLNAYVFIPGSQYLPTPSNLKTWKLDRKIRKTLKQIIESRLHYLSTKDEIDWSFGDDLLGVMIEAGPKWNMKEILDECKTFFVAGHETTSNWLTWTVFLLSVHSEWQEKLREEVLQNCGMEIPNADMLSKLKLLNMVLLEALRLYGPVLTLLRETSQDIKLGNLSIPKNTGITIAVAMIHWSTKYWGEDANTFNPLRFIDGVSKAAKHPNALLAFSTGPRVCIGQNFATLEAKTVMTLILQRFSLSLSSNYQHAPVENLTLQPQYGLPIIVKPLHV